MSAISSTTTTRQRRRCRFGTSMSLQAVSCIVLGSLFLVLAMTGGAAIRGGSLLRGENKKAAEDSQRELLQKIVVFDFNDAPSLGKQTLGDLDDDGMMELDGGMDDDDGVGVVESVLEASTTNSTNTTTINATILEDISTPAPTLEPTTTPTPAPTLDPTAVPSAPTASPTAQPTIEPFGPIDYVGNDNGGYYAPYPLGVCQGDCDVDEDCLEGLYCYQRGSFQDVPGCTGGDRYSATGDFCVWNTTYPKPDPPQVYQFAEFDYVGNDGTWYATYPLSVCKGDCDTDDDCAQGLFCYDRSPNDAAPGCMGAEDDATTADICVWNTSFPMPKPVPEAPSEAFRLKLYWEEGYLWQNETFEREWCMSYSYDGYPGTGGCWYARDFMNCSQDSVYMALCIDDDPRQWFTFEELGTTYNDVDEVLVKTSGEDRPRCFARSQSAIYLTPDCNPNDEKQRFFAVQGSLSGYRFELGQYQGYTRDNCLTNAHHPKSGEVVEFHVCESVREEHDQTSYWEKFAPQTTTWTSVVRTVP